MAQGEIDGECAGTSRGEHRGASGTVGSIRSHRRRQWYARSIEHRRQAAPNGSEPDVRLAHVVQERSSQHFGRIRRHGSSPHGFEGMALVGERLGPEKWSLFAGQNPSDDMLLCRAQWLSEHRSEEAPYQVRHRLETVADQRFALHSTHKREVGRNSIRAAPISLPHDSQLP